MLGVTAEVAVWCVCVCMKVAGYTGKGFFSAGKRFDLLQSHGLLMSIIFNRCVFIYLPNYLVICQPLLSRATFTY